MMMLSSSSPVTASTSSGGRAIPARSSTWISVASPSMHLVLELVLEVLEAERRAARSASPRGPSRAASARRSSRPCRRPRRWRTSGVASSAAGASMRTASVERRDRRLRRADRAHPPLRVEVRARRVQDADDDAAGRRSASRPPGRSRDSCCRRPWRRPRRRRPGSPARCRISASMPWPTTKPPGQSGAEAGQRLLLLVDRRHVPALRGEVQRDSGADSPAADDDQLHALSLRLSRTPCGKATTSTSQGACRRT